MKKSVNETGYFANSESMFNKSKLIMFIVLIIIVILVVLGYFLFYYSKICKNENCFFSAVNSCKRASWIKEDLQSVWSYKIKKSYDKNSCDVETKLLKIKQGTIEIEKLQGKKMNCIMNKGTRNYPEKTLSMCSGPLKEEMQEIIIQRMHNYILQNIGEVKQGFSEILGKNVSMQANQSR